MPMLIGYARCSTNRQDLRAQKNQLLDLGVEERRIYTDFGYTGRNRNRPGLREAMSATRPGDTFVVTKLDRLARSVEDATTISRELHEGDVTIRIGAETFDPHSPYGKMLFTVLAMVAEFEANLISQRTIEGMEIARAAGRLKGRQSQFTKRQQQEILAWLRSDDYTQAEIAELMSVHPSTISRMAKKFRSEGALPGSSDGGTGGKNGEQ
ncbi:recombinase family protein [Corynebacterium sp. A21]|uniref:recombinase family protein n=1 Tax=Corynebacterium sp. A21 TaxID=3457318 RepID=UPI003FD423FE